MPTQLRRCPGCADERAFEAPPCAEGHGGECAERVCLDCGTALLVDPPAALPRPRALRSRVTRPAPPRSALSAA